ncbi:MAG: hypothetical protein IT561_09710 [Alphaproteobacteria bacterium]|nr:hypothetical protein [Alphaproteobacteria bacterium]
MSPFYSTYAGMLDYMAREFEGLAHADAENAPQLRRNAEILAHMAAEFDAAPRRRAPATALFDHPV